MLLGAAMLIPRRVFDLVGGWDEDYFFGGEDLDLSSRIGRHYRLLFYPEAEVTHFGGVSTKLNLDFASTAIMIGFLKFLRKCGYSRATLLFYKLMVTLDLPLQISYRLLQTGLRLFQLQRKKALRSWQVLRSLIHFVCKGLPNFWQS